MSTNDGTVRIRVVADNATKTGLDAVEAGFKRLGSTLGGAAMDGAKFAAKLATIAETAMLAAPSLIAAGQAVVGIVKAAGAAAPALLALAAAGLFVKMTMTAIVPAIGRHMEAIGDAFDLASQKAGHWATRGIRPLAAEWAKAAMPRVSRDMSSIATTVNTVTKGFLQWGKSVAGITALNNVTHATKLGMAELGPSVQGVAISFGNMLGRISGVSIAAGSSGLSGILDKLNAKLDSITGQTVTDGLNKLREAFQGVRDIVTQVKNAVSIGTEYWFKYQKQIGLVRDALSVLAIAFGGPIGIAIGGASLIQRHWDKIKPVIDKVKKAFDGLDTSGAKGAMERLGGAVSWLKGQWEDLSTWFKGTLWPLIRDELPAIWEAAKEAMNSIMKAWDDNKQAIGEFFEVVKVVGKWVIENLVPIFGKNMVTALKLLGGGISGAIRGFGLFARAVVAAVEASLTAFGWMINGAAKAFGWIPGIGPKLKRSAADFNVFRNRVNTELAAIRNKNISISVNTAGALSKIAAVRNSLNAVQLAGAGAYIGRGGYAHGGIVGAATGGVHSGLRWVGEQGPELVSMAPGSTVHSAGDSARIAREQRGSGGGDARALIDIRGGNDDFAVFMRKVVKIYGGGSVQAAFGTGNA